LKCFASQDFPWALGLPNAALHGSCQSPCKSQGQDVSLLLLISSPTYNATTGLLTYSATKLPGWGAKFLDQLDTSSDISGVAYEIADAKLWIDSTEEVVADGAEGTDGIWGVRTASGGFLISSL